MVAASASRISWTHWHRFQYTDGRWWAPSNSLGTPPDLFQLSLIIHHSQRGKELVAYRDFFRVKSTGSEAGSPTRWDHKQHEPGHVRCMRNLDSGLTLDFGLPMGRRVTENVHGAREAPAHWQRLTLSVADSLHILNDVLPLQGPPCTKWEWNPTQPSLEAPIFPAHRQSRSHRQHMNHMV